MSVLYIQEHRKQPTILQDTPTEENEKAVPQALLYYVVWLW